MKLLDTTFLIHYWGGFDGVATYLESNEQAEFTTTTFNIKEIAVGQALQGQLDSNVISSTFEWLRIIPFEADHAITAAELEATLHQKESVNQDKINSLTGDLLIAAVAKSVDATVVTQNTTDFEQFDGVSVESYPLRTE